MDLGDYVVESQDETDVTGGAGSGTRSTWMVVVAVLVVLTFVVAFIMWRRRYHSKPNCSKYTGDAAAMCKQLTSVCKDDGACLNAAAHCLPIAASLAGAPTPAAAAGALASFNQRDLTACTEAVAALDPKRVAAMSGACIPPDMALAAQAIPAAEAAAYYDAMANVVQAGRPLVPWGVHVAQALPTCPPQ